MTNLTSTATVSNPLVELQNEFCLFSFDSQLRIGVRKEIADIIAGQRADDINMYRLADGKILMRRHLETLPINSAPKQVTDDFLVDPNSLK